MLRKRLDPITIAFHHFNACSPTVVQRGLLCWCWWFYAFCTGPISLNFGMKLQKMNMNLISKTLFFFCYTFVNVCHVQLKAKMDHTSLWLRNADVLTFRFWYYYCHIYVTQTEYLPCRLMHSSGYLEYRITCTFSKNFVGFSLKRGK